jgi:predicted nuclease of restriction endonuclease-like (RecB) superfamily
MEVGMNQEVVEYGSFIKEIKDLVYTRQYEALKQVNAQLIALYWDIGERITKKQAEQGWGKSVVEVLAKELQAEFPGVQGFSARNLWLMRGFYAEYAANAKLQPLVAEISWAKNILIMQKCKDALEREFYIKMTKKYGWSKDVLINNIENNAYAQVLTNQTNFHLTLPEAYRSQAKLAVKDEYSFDFIEMGPSHSEAELEAGILKNIRKFLAEMGGDFSYIGNQFHLDIAGKDYYIDLLLFHRRLRSLVAIDLKIGEFIPEYAGKMQFYLNALDETIKMPDENPSVGIIICKEKNRMTVEYTLKTANMPIGVATYSYYKSLPKDIREHLPSPDTIAAIIESIDSKDD